MAEVVTVQKTVDAGRLAWRVLVVETNVADVNEVEIEGGFPAEGTITSYEADLLAGTGTTINPMLGKAAAFVEDDPDHIATQSEAAARINDNTSLQYSGLQDGKLYLQSGANNAAADHNITTRFTVVAGHVA